MIDHTILKTHVDDLVAKHGASVVPDAIEKKLYCKFITLIMDAMDKMSGRTMFRIFGHEIAFFIKPAPVAIQFRQAS